MTNWPHDIADDLPAPRDDEPSSLRQDIADELADHLHSSFVRELHRTPEEASARQHVLDRFGDPRRVARQLWFDAMKEKIMSQRLMLTALLLTAIACLGTTGLSWMLVQQSREANQALLEQAQEARLMNREILTQNEAANSRMLDRLAAMAAPAPAAPPKSMEWNSVNIKLVTEKAGESPAKGYEVRLSGFMLDTAKAIEIVRKTGDDGIADMGLVRPGEHELHIATPWSESRQSSQITVLPGQDLVAEIMCPAADRGEAPVSFAVDWPDDLGNRGLWVVCLADLEGRSIDGGYWLPPSRLKHQFFVITAAHDLLYVPGNFNFDEWVVPGVDKPFEFAHGLSSESTGLYVDAVKLRNRRQFGSKPSDQSAPPGGEITSRPYHFQFQSAPAQPDRFWPAGRYMIRNILIAEAPAQQVASGLQKIDVLGGIMSNLDRTNGLRGFNAMEHPFVDWVESTLQRGNPDEPRKRVEEPRTFEVELGKPNQIHIPIAQKLAEMVRKSLDDSK